MLRHVGATQPGSGWVGQLGSAEVQVVIVCADVAVIEHKTSKKYYQRVVPCSFIAMESLDF